MKKTITNVKFDKNPSIGYSEKQSMMWVYAEEPLFDGAVNIPKNHAWRHGGKTIPKLIQNVVGCLTHETLHVVLNREHVCNKKCSKKCQKGMDRHLQLDDLDAEFQSYARYKIRSRKGNYRLRPFVNIRFDGMPVYFEEYLAKWQHMRKENK